MLNRSFLDLASLYEVSSRQIEDEHLGGAAVVDDEPGLAGEADGVTGLQGLAVEADRAARGVHLGQPPRIEGNLRALGIVETTR